MKRIIFFILIFIITIVLYGFINETIKNKQELKRFIYTQKIYKDLRYASNSKSQVIDIYIPKSTGRMKVIVYIHGGAFEHGSQKQIPWILIKYANKNGYAIISADHRKSSEAIFPAAVADIKAVIRWIRANAKRFNFDENHITVWGESSGAYLACMTALTPTVKYLDADVKTNINYSSKVNNLVSFYAGLELYTFDKEFRELGFKQYQKHESYFSSESKFIGQPVMLDKEKTYKTYWETYSKEIPANYKLKAFIFAGNKDNQIPYTQSEKLANKLNKIIGPENVKFLLIDGANHGGSVFFSDRYLDMIFDYIDK